MIVKLSAPTGLRFSGATLPEAVQDLALRHAVVARIVSRSMYPTLRPDDCLEIAPADSIYPGDLAVYRRPGGLVCHRVIEVVAGKLTTRGDAEAGLSERISREDVIGKVVAVVRGSARLPIEELAETEVTINASRLESLSHPARMRRYAVCVIRALLNQPRIGPPLSRVLIRLSTVEPVTPSPVRVFEQAILSSPDAPSLSLSLDCRQRTTLPCLLRLGPIRLGTIEKSGAVMLRPALADTSLESALRRAIQPSQ